MSAHSLRHLELTVAYRTLDTVREFRTRVQQRGRATRCGLLCEHRAARGGVRSPLDTCLLRTVLLHQHPGAARLAVVRGQPRGEELVTVCQGFRPSPRLSES